MNALLAEPLLTPGMRLSQPEFHARYKRMPDHTVYELIGGVVHIASPLGLRHGDWTNLVSGVLFTYQTRTPGVRPSAGTSTILNDTGEVQPDVSVRIRPGWGGAVREENNVLRGVPELVIEIADSNEDTALGVKFAAYRNAGGREYLVVCLETRELRWFDLRRETQMRADRGGVLRSRMFPGLWLDGPALWAEDPAGLEATVRAGMNTEAHAAFVKRLERRRQAHARRNPPPAS